VVATQTKKPGANTAGGTAIYDRSGIRIWQLDDAYPLHLKGKRIVVALVGEKGTMIERYDWQTGALLWSVSLGGRTVNPWQGGAVERDGRLYWAWTMIPWDVEERMWLPERAVLDVFDLATGRLLAGTTTGKLGGPETGWGRCPPAVDDRLLAWGVSHWLHRLDPVTLAPLVKSRYEGGNTYPILGDDLLFVKGWLHYVQAYGRRHHERIWTVGAPRDTAHALLPGKGGKQLLVESSSALDTRTGKTAVTFKVPGPQLVGEGVAGSGDLVYFAGYRLSKTMIGGFYAFEASTGRHRWKYEAPELRGQAVIVSSGRVYGIAYDHGADRGSLYAFAPVRSPLPRRRRP
jgi:outer membrane protein assembly factor BamB